MHNKNLDKLTDYPFDRLRSLLKNVEPPTNSKPMIMSLGEPQHQPPLLLSKTINKHASEWGKYPPVIGTLDCREAIIDWLVKRYNLKPSTISPDQNVITVSGTREALYMVGDIVIPEKKNNKKPSVLIPNPFYQVYIGATIMNRATPVYLPATKKHRFLPNYNSLDKTVLENTALAYLCTPSNPQGSIADIDYLKQAILLARKYNFILAIDECYAEIYDYNAPPGGLEACQLLGGGFENVLVFHSLSKRSNSPGLRSGFVAGDPELIARFKVLRNYGGASIPIPLLAASAALWRDENHVEENRAAYRQKFDIADQILSGSLDYYRPNGGFYLWLNVENGEAATSKLWSKAGIHVIPGAYLAKSDISGNNPGSPYIRVALVQEPRFIEEALTHISNLLA